MRPRVFCCAYHSVTPCEVVMLLPVGDRWFVSLCLAGLRWWEAHGLMGMERGECEGSR